MIRTYFAGAVLQARLLRRQPFDMIILFTLPLQTAGFLSIFRHFGRSDLDSYALMAPALIALWQMSLTVSGEIIATERDSNTLEPLVAAPASFAALLFGRISTVTIISLLGFAEAALTGWIFFGANVEIVHGGVFLITILMTALATSSSAILMAVLFILSRSPRIFQNSLSYPFYILGGVLVPVSLLPQWIQDLSTLFYLSWSADLLRDTADVYPITDWLGRIFVVLLLASITLIVGQFLLQMTLLRARRDGKVGVV